MIDAALRQFVRNRAGHRCEYCRIHQADESYFRFHIEHIIARQHEGTDDAENLALACHHCNLRRGPNLTGVDTQSGTIVALFHPRRQKWTAHFARQGPIIVGLTPTGRATVQLLQMNAVPRVELRRALASG